MFSRILIANRGEIAIRIARAASQLDVESIAIYSVDDSRSLHVHRADRAVALTASGAGAYLDIDDILSVAVRNECDAIHPGYGFLSENAEFAQRCSKQGIEFIGPSAEALRLFGDKPNAREFAMSCGVSTVDASSVEDGLSGARDLLGSLGAGGAIMIKAANGGGGRGMRVVDNPALLDEEFARSQSEASAAFGNGDVFAERLVRDARHIEVQVIGDGHDVVHVWERECSLQRRHQKVLEVAPSPSLDSTLRAEIVDAAVRIAKSAKYENLGTLEFLVAREHESLNGSGFVFMEANPRLQVEHTVTEEVTGIDFVETQIRVAAGETLQELGLSQDTIPTPRGYAVQLRVNMETIQTNGQAFPSSGTIEVFEPPTGLGVRVDGFGYGGYTVNPSFDSLLAKLIVKTGTRSFPEVIKRADRALSEFRIEGIDTNIPFLRSLLQHPDVAENNVHIRFIDDNLETLLANASAEDDQPEAFFGESGSAGAGQQTVVGHPVAPVGMVAVASPLLGTIVSIGALQGAQVAPGATVAVVESMKMEHVIVSPSGGMVGEIVAAVGDTVTPDMPLMFLEPRDTEDLVADAADEVDLCVIRSDLADLKSRTLQTLDEGRSESVAKRHSTGYRTARENIDDLVDSDSFMEYGAFVIAAQRARRTHEDLLASTPADGLIAGTASINGDRFEESRSRAAVVAYDWTVFAGTQGVMGPGLLT